MRGRGGTLFLGALVLALGVAIGAIGMRAYDMRLAVGWMAAPQVERRTDWIVRSLDRRLDLDESQRAQLRAIAEEQEPAFRAVLVSAEPERRRLRRELLQRSETFLRPEQQQELRRVLERIDARDANLQQNHDSP